MRKPAELFDRDGEWGSLDRFVASGRRGTAMGLLYGRRRQGKTFLLQHLVEVGGGFYFSALQQSAAQNLARLAEAYGAHIRSPAPLAFPTWDAAVEAVLAIGRDAKRPVPVVIDEFPYLLHDAPEVPSLLQAALAPMSTPARSWPTRLILCGSSLSTMRALLTGTAPLRGRASLELVVHPFGYRDAAEFWGVANKPELAMRLHALVGGTPAYLDMSGGQGPASFKDLDEWVITALLDPSSAMFREGNVLLAEEDRITDPSPYYAVLGAISQGRTRRGEIASALGRPENALAHPLTVLTETRLVDALGDALREKRTTYHIAEPILRLHQLVIAPHQVRLERRQAAAVWAELGPTVASKIYGPHFEQLCRDWCVDHATPETLGSSATNVGPTAVACRSHRQSHEVDVVVTSGPQRTRHGVVAIGEAKWRTRPSGREELDRLDHVREVAGLSDGVKILLFSRLGFDRSLTAAARKRPDVELIGLDHLYTCS